MSEQNAKAPPSAELPNAETQEIRIDELPSENARTEQADALRGGLASYAVRTSADKDPPTVPLGD
ncbi:MAG TPA: hypothetical protein VKA84_16945 [Gemmatimonadaceae bacterium]|nr:hypothetical protein [Gemmatimonadaceae bacterium]